MRPGTRVLVIEDDPASARLVTDYLRAKGARVEWARDGTSGVERATTEDFDCIVLDLRLPGDNGFVVAEKIRAATGPSAGPPIVVTSAFPDKPNRVRAFQAGVDAFLAKPIDLDELYLVVSNLSDRKQVAQERYEAALALAAALLMPPGRQPPSSGGLTPPGGQPPSSVGLTPPGGQPSSGGPEPSD